MGLAGRGRVGSHGLGGDIVTASVDPNSSLYRLLGIVQAHNPDLIRLVEAPDEQTFVEVTEVGVERAIRTIENGAKHYSKLDERGLSRLLADFLNKAGWQATAEREHNGHVDIVVEHMLFRQWKVLGECKIYDGYEYHIEGCDQLLGYLTGREPRSFCLDFFKVPAMFEKLRTIRARMDSELPLQQVSASQDHAIGGAFTTAHTHATQAEVAILHVGCTLKPNT